MWEGKVEAVGDLFVGVLFQASRTQASRVVKPGSFAGSQGAPVAVNAMFVEVYWDQLVVEMPDAMF